MYTKGHIVNIARVSIPATLVFHFNHSLRPFIWISSDSAGESIFIDLNFDYSYLWSELESCGLQFYTKEDDEDFCGVEVICDIRDYVG